MSTPSHQVLEELNVFTPLGLRFWDGALDRSIDEGLRVVARPWHDAGKQVQATRNRSGVYTFRWLPGMRAYEYDQSGRDDHGAAALGRRAFLVTVEDTQARFLPAAFRIELPLPYRGVFLAEGDGSTPDGSRRGVYLFSAPTRRVDERLTAVRGTLLNDADGEPVAWAVVVVRAPHGAEFHGLSDEAGRFVVMFPFPSLAHGFEGSPAMFGNGTPIAERGWDITLEVRAQASALRPLAPSALPDYRSVFEQAEAALLQSDDPSAQPQPELALRLPFDQQLIVRTHNSFAQLVIVAP